MQHNQLLDRMVVADNNKAAARLKMLQDQLDRIKLAEQKIATVEVGKVTRILE